MPSVKKNRHILILFLGNLFLALFALFLWQIIFAEIKKAKVEILQKSTFSPDKIHSLLYFKDRLYALIQAKPSKIIKIDPKTLSFEREIQFPSDGQHEQAAEQVFIKNKDRIYVVFQGNNISEIHPDTLTFQDINKAVSSKNSNGATITTDDKFLYILTTTKPSLLRKISLENFQEGNSIQLDGLDYGHALKSDGVRLYATGVTNPAWIAILNNSILHQATFNNAFPTDDLAVSENYIFICFEDKSGIVIRMEKNDPDKIVKIDTGIPSKCFGTFFLNKSIFALFDSQPNQIVRIDPNNLRIRKYQLPDGYRSPSELAFDGKDYYLGFYSSSPILKIKFD